MADWSVPICTGWYVKPNPEGPGLVLCAERTLKAHTQVVSCFVAATPDKEDVEHHLADRPAGSADPYRRLYESIIGKLEVLCTEMFDMGWFHHVEQIGLTTHYTLIRSISRAAELRHRERTGG